MPVDKLRVVHHCDGCPGYLLLRREQVKKQDLTPFFLQSRIQLEDTSMTRRALSFRGFLDIFTAH